MRKYPEWVKISITLLWRVKCVKCTAEPKCKLCFIVRAEPWNREPLTACWHPAVSSIEPAIMCSYAASKKRISPLLASCYCHTTVFTQTQERTKVKHLPSQVKSILERFTKSVFVVVGFFFYFYPIMIWRLWNEAGEDVECCQPQNGQFLYLCVRGSKSWLTL